MTRCVLLEGEVVGWPCGKPVIRVQIPPSLLPPCPPALFVWFTIGLPTDVSADNALLHVVC